MESGFLRFKKVFQIGHTALLEDIRKHGKFVSFAPGETIINYGDSTKMVPLVVAGSLKVIRGDEEGREVFLYYLQPGEACAMSLTCCTTHQPSPIRAVAEETTELLFIPVDQHEQWTGTYHEWKALVAQTYALRFQDLLRTIDSIAFKNMDERLVVYLQTKFRQLDTTTLSITHQEIANELGTSREVISRLLKQLEKRGGVALKRNKITLSHADADFLAM